MNKTKKIIFGIAFLPLVFFSFVNINQVQAGETNRAISGLNVTASSRNNLKKAFKPGSTNASALLIINFGDLISKIITFVGIIFLILVIYGGFLWMTASGNEQQVDKSKKIIIWATIGIIALSVSYAAVNFIGTRIASYRDVNLDSEDIKRMEGRDSFDLAIPDNSLPGIGTDNDDENDFVDGIDLNCFKLSDCIINQEKCEQLGIYCEFL